MLETDSNGVTISWPIIMLHYETKRRLIRNCPRSRRLLGVPLSQKDVSLLFLRAQRICYQELSANVYQLDAFYLVGLLVSDDVNHQCCLQWIFNIISSNYYMEGNIAIFGYIAVEKMFLNLLKKCILSHVLRASYTP